MCSNKAVAHGAVSFFLEQFVSARVMKMNYGTQVVFEYDSSDPEHYARRDMTFVRCSGRTMVKNGYSTIIKKVTALDALTFTKTDSVSACASGSPGPR